MTVIRRRHNRNFTVVTNEVMDDERLSAEALGVLNFLLSRSSNWNVSTAHLGKRFNMGKDRTLRIIKELREAGYLTKEFERDAKGQIVGTEYVVYDAPQNDEDADHPEYRQPPLPPAVKPAPENPPAIVRNNTTNSPLVPPSGPGEPPDDRAATPPARVREAEGGDNTQAQSVSTSPPVASPASETATAAVSGNAVGSAGQEKGVETSFDRQREADAGFDEFWLDYKLRNPKYRDDARKRWLVLDTDQRAKAHSRLAQYFGARIGEAQARKGRPNYATAAEYLGDRIFEKYAPALNAPRPQQPARRMRGEDAILTPMGLEAARDGWIGKLYEFVDRSGSLPKGTLVETLSREGQQDLAKHQERADRGEPADQFERMHWQFSTGYLVRVKRFTEKAEEAARQRGEITEQSIEGAAA